MFYVIVGRIHLVTGNRQGERLFAGSARDRGNETSDNIIYTKEWEAVCGIGDRAGVEMNLGTDRPYALRLLEIFFSWSGEIFVESAEPFE
jgi:hypothetical protein